MSSSNFDILWEYFSGVKSKRSSKHIKLLLEQEPEFVEVLAGLKKLEEALPEEVSLKEYMEARKAFLKKNIF